MSHASDSAMSCSAWRDGGLIITNHRVSSCNPRPAPSPPMPPSRRRGHPRTTMGPLRPFCTVNTLIYVLAGRALAMRRPCVHKLATPRWRVRLAVSLLGLRPIRHRQAIAGGRSGTINCEGLRRAEMRRHRVMPNARFPADSHHSLRDPRRSALRPTEASKAAVCYVRNTSTPAVCSALNSGQSRRRAQAPPSSGRIDPL